MGTACENPVQGPLGLPKCSPTGREGMEFVLVVGFPAGALQANCYLLASSDGAECVLVDPGQDACDGVRKALAEHDLRPAAVLATHGHFDHIQSAAALADAHDVPVWIHSADRRLLSDPSAGLGPELAAAVGLPELTEPRRVELLDGFAGRSLELAGLTLDVDHTPGHTPGSVVFRCRTAEGGSLAFTGDTLFAGTVGRTDLPGGDPVELERSLRESILPLTDETVLLPGHGQPSTIGRERGTNPFFAAAARD